MDWILNNLILEFVVVTGSPCIESNLVKYKTVHGGREKEIESEH
jgi:hypothetical protein